MDDTRQRRLCNIKKVTERRRATAGGTRRGGNPFDVNETEDTRDGLQMIIDIYKKDVDVTLLDENLKLTPGERLRKLQRNYDFFEMARKARKVE